MNSEKVRRQAADTGRVREVTITDQLGAKMAAGTARRAKLSAATARWKNPAEISGVFHMGLKEER